MTTSASKAIKGELDCNSDLVIKQGPAWAGNTYRQFQEEVGIYHLPQPRKLESGTLTTGIKEVIKGQTHRYVDTKKTKVK